ncbi:hypothetical protein RSP795_11905 [Ralstonia solanacearum]|uniref:hypothetical protein n=1 Tax=Ralstonia solanacearum TaxID=305 RepID=UPI000709E84D|nr:hypothetical protein [Ralstonia solanacearum]MDB0542316.1 hypothetical protein [Ralstonia solanacearum]MDB0551553.1 hypothetical protein [Ralstonia solanacearum]MDB0557279.1 hypothetical protein [Ralstonia solanacearum]OAI62502.1 hypothetical protein RSP795_11905 [Ralstonia solanacearum]
MGAFVPVQQDLAQQVVVVLDVPLEAKLPRVTPSPPASTSTRTASMLLVRHALMAARIQSSGVSCARTVGAVVVPASSGTVSG